MEYSNPLECFGCDVFSDAIMQNRLDPLIYAALRRTIDEGSELEYKVAEAVANAMKDWAIEKGATHYTHWFQPMTGSTAQKHDAFLEIQSLNSAPILKFSGKALIRGEADGSSFPSGGLRATFEARGYTTWDCTSAAFVKQDGHGSCCLYIPTAFCSFSGEALDEKTPLLRSMEALSREAVAVLRLLGINDVKRVIPTVGSEQEYFLVDKHHFLKRKDLVYTGRTLFGAPPAKGQELSDQYYASTPERVTGFMNELNIALWRLGVPAKTEHNETAPAQYELAPLYASANVATDHNQLVMELMRRVAGHHGFVCLLHEKPFYGVNGSGKHNNWSLMTDTGVNLLKPGKTEQTARIFYTFLAAVLAAVDEYAPALRMSCATLGNEHRLGGHEAPPQIISVFTGTKLYNELMGLAAGGLGELHVKEQMRTGVRTLAVLHKDDSDRNRTSPFAFTGNKFEFRMVGASQSIGLPNTVLNTIVAEMLKRIGKQLSRSKEPLSAWREIAGALILKHGRVIFNGNNYAKEWVAEAKNRGLPNISSTVDAINIMAHEKIQDVFERHCVFSPEELNARRDIALYGFVQMARIEASTMLKIAKQKLLPACIRFCGEIAKAYNETKAAGMETTAKKRLLTRLCANIDLMDEAIEALYCALQSEEALENDTCSRALIMRENVLPLMKKLRAAADELERIVDKDFWPLPSYGEMMFHIV
ncbi:MAG TPA: glutamine synthetase III [Clostridia bacterium]|nr:glutamine synthetase III [Clostridia bacterium]